MILGAAAQFGHLPCIVVSELGTGSSQLFGGHKQKRPPREGTAIGGR